METQPQTPEPEFEYQGRGLFKPSVSMKDYLYRIISKRGPITRPELTKVTGIPRTTIYDTIAKLMLEERVQKFASPAKHRGRPRVFYEIVPETA